jgi:hypothetical protein
MIKLLITSVLVPILTDAPRWRVLSAFLITALPSIAFITANLRDILRMLKERERKASDR